MKTLEIIEPPIHKPPCIFIKTYVDLKKCCAAIESYCATVDLTGKSNTLGTKLQLKISDRFIKAAQ